MRRALALAAAAPLRCLPGLGDQRGNFIGGNGEIVHRDTLAALRRRGALAIAAPRPRHLHARLTGAGRRLARRALAGRMT
jgi:hypothetical protein